MSAESAYAITNFVRVRDLPVLADIGINPDEIGRRQPLVVSVELELDVGQVSAVEQTVDYRRVARAVEELALVHIPLIETFGQQLAEQCLSMKNVACAKVEIDKPFALTRGKAGVEVIMRRA